MANIIEILTQEEMQERERIYLEVIEPLLDKIQTICEEHKFPLLAAIQLYVDPARGARISVQQSLMEGATGQFSIAAKVLRGEMPIMPVPAESLESALEGLRVQAGESLREHAEHCEDCRREMEKLEAAGEDITDMRVLSELAEKHQDSLSDAENIDVEIPSIFSNKSKLIH